MPADRTRALAAQVSKDADLARLHELMALIGDACTDCGRHGPAEASAGQSQSQTSGGAARIRRKTAVAGSAAHNSGGQDQAEHVHRGRPPARLSRALCQRLSAGRRRRREGGAPRLGGSACRQARLGRLRRRQFDVARRELCARRHRPRPSRRHAGVGNSVGTGGRTACRRHHRRAVILRVPWRRNSAGGP